MQAVADIQSRILDIQSRMQQLDRIASGGAGGVLGGAVVGSAATAGGGVVAAGTVTGTGMSTASSSAAFGAALQQATATGATGPTSPGYGKHLVNGKGDPVEYQQYGNGKVPAQALSPIAGGDGHKLWAPAARSFEALREAAAADGVTIGITDSYRPYETQVDLVRRKGLYSQGGLAATPGTSNHGWGTALDLRLDGAAQSWMRENAGTYGFVEDVPREPWHWHYVPTH